MLVIFCRRVRIVPMLTLAVLPAEIGCGGHEPPPVVASEGSASKELLTDLSGLAEIPSPARDVDVTLQGPFDGGHEVTVLYRRVTNEWCVILVPRSPVTRTSYCSSSLDRLRILGGPWCDVADPGSVELAAFITHRLVDLRSVHSGDGTTLCSFSAVPIPDLDDVHLHVCESASLLGAQVVRAVEGSGPVITIDSTALGLAATRD